MKVKSCVIAIIFCAVINTRAQAIGTLGFTLPTRYYDATVGRFVSADPIVQAPADPQSLNRYAYVRNNPLNLVDPSGYSWLSKSIKKNSETWGVGLQIFGGPLGVVGGGAMLSQSESGRNILAGELLVASAIGTAYCGGCGAGWGAVTGEVAGGYMAHRSGGDILTGAVIGGAQGAAMGGMMQGIDQAGMHPLMEIGVKGHIGGVFTAANGGSYEKGFAYMAAAASAQQIFESVVGYQATPEPGQPLPDGTYEAGLMPNRAPPPGYAVTGENTPVQGNPWARQNIFKQAGGIGKLGNWTPGIKATSQFHDTWVNNMTNFNFVKNVGTMLPSLGIATGALGATYWSPFTTHMAIQDSR